MSELPPLSSSINQEGAPNRLSDASTSDATSDQGLAGSGSPSDPASSLRAAALLTLRSNRRKPTADQPVGLPHLPIPSGNYGEKEYSAPTTAASSAVEQASAPPSRTIVLEAEDNREEGEISDTDNTLPAVPKHKSSLKKTRRAKATAADRKSTKTSPKPSPTSSKPPPRAKVPSKPPQQEIALPAPAVGPSVPPTSSLPASSPPAPQHDPPRVPYYIVDADHVRPGLAMNAQSYENAKDIILDLLGWGVEPEYIVEAGVSRETIFYIFTELHLRLPRNLDTTGLVPYHSPPPERAQVPAPPRQSLSLRSASSLMTMPPPHSIPPGYEAPRRVAHPSLPPPPAQYNSLPRNNF